MMHGAILCLQTAATQHWRHAIPVIGVDPSGEIVGTIFDVASWCVSVCEVTANPMDMWAWANLIADTFDLLPVATGTGEVVRAVRTADRTTVAFNALAEAMQAQKKTKYSANMVGQMGESLARISGNKKAVNVGNRTRIPDELTKHSLTEVKNVARLYNTQQLKDFAQYARDNKLEKILFVRPTTPISPSLVAEGWTIKCLWR